MGSAPSDQARAELHGIDEMVVAFNGPGPRAIPSEPTAAQRGRRDNAESLRSSSRHAGDQYSASRNATHERGHEGHEHGLNKGGLLRQRSGHLQKSGGYIRRSE